MKALGAEKSFYIEGVGRVTLWGVIARRWLDEGIDKERFDMDFKAARQYILSRQEAIEDFPFGPDAAVFKVHGKMFALLHERAGMPRLNLKCDPHEALMLRDIFPAVLPGYHMNKKHWNTVLLDGSIPRGEVERMIDLSWALVVKGLPRPARDALKLKSL